MQADFSNPQDHEGWHTAPGQVRWILSAALKGPGREYMDGSLSVTYNNDGVWEGTFRGYPYKIVDVELCDQKEQKVDIVPPSVFDLTIL